jgi:hypothetical protein
MCTISLYAAAVWCYNRDSTYTYRLVRIDDDIRSTAAHEACARSKMRLRSAGLLTGTVLAAAVVAAAVLLGAAQVGAQAVGAQPAVGALETGSFCRLGVDLYKDLPVQTFDLAGLRSGWYVDYYAPGAAHAEGMDYAIVISMRQEGDDGYRLDRPWDKIDALILANPGAIWLVGNEPDRVDVQDDMMPRAYAAGYHDLYYYIKARDPSAQVVAGSIVQATPLRLQYLDLVLDAYRNRYGEPLPADGWSIHGYLLNERSCAAFPQDCWGAGIPRGITATEGLVLGYGDAARIDLFIDQVVRFRRWMAANGYRSRPFYVTEFGVLMPPSLGYPPQVVNRFMREAFDYMLGAQDAQLGYGPDGNRLVQRIAWYATVAPQANGALFEGLNANKPISPPYGLSEIGLAYQAYARALTPTFEIAVAAADLAPAFPLAGGEPAAEFTATLALTVAGTGNLAAPAGATVSLYDGAPDGELLAPAQSVAVAGCGAAANVAFTWRSPPEGARAGFLTVVAAWPGGSATQRIAYFAPHAWAFVPLITP